MKKIIVGIDGSACSLDALRWAVGEAARRGDRVVALYAWSRLPVSTVHEALHVLETETAVREGAARFLYEAVSQALAGREDVPVECIVVEGSPARALLDAAGDAELLVVGSRGLGGFKGLLLGSVSQQCVHHARCPVVVVRQAVREAAAEREEAEAATAS
jgi:nucleotide-binding universal stress UspA family protein